jgi:hypothetical protein
VSASMIARIVMVQVFAGVFLLLRYYFQIPSDVMHAATLAGLLIVAIGWPIGFILGRYLSHDSDVDTRAFKVVAGVNLIAWLIPVIGMVLSTMTLQFSKRSEAARIFYWSLAAIGGWGALANAWISGASQFRFDQIQESCHAAVPKNWSPQDVENYCLRGINPHS